MNFDKYNEVINGEITYKKIASDLLKLFSVGIGWTDENGTHLDIILILEIIDMKIVTFIRYLTVFIKKTNIKI